MGFLDRIVSILGGSKSASDPKGPLGLMPGDTLRYYHEQFRVEGTRLVLVDGASEFQYRLASAGGSALLVARDESTDSWSLRRPIESADLPWKSKTWQDEEGEPYTLANESGGRVRLFGATGVDGARHVSTRIFQDAEQERLLVLEDWGVRREAWTAEPVFDGEITFDGGGGRIENRPWAADAAPTADPALDGSSNADDDVLKGSPLAAALALEGRLAPDAPDPTTYVAQDALEFDDAEWGDANDEGAAVRTIAAVASVSARDTCPAWLRPTHFVLGSGHAPSEDPDDDWLGPR